MSPERRSTIRAALDTHPAGELQQIATELLSALDDAATRLAHVARLSAVAERAMAEPTRDWSQAILALNAISITAQGLDEPV
jgi:hypothetical protein